ncbi:MAG: B12-binding domain-containing radical SAM protein [Polyangiaceae bacterium]|nr:B12-binding domain-containing radical SAM protein [Polyangiaceae bacterium]
MLHSRIDPEEPFRTPLKSRAMPEAMRVAPPLDGLKSAGPITRRRALLINPFYPKDPNASFGKHVLTPTLALTSIAGATPPGWHVAYWDENLLMGPPPCDPLPEVVGISVHLTFAERAYELARAYRSLGCKVIFGGLHVLSSPDEVRGHADAIAVGDGVALWPEILGDIERGELKPEYRAMFDRPYRDDPPPRRDLLPRASFLTTTSVNATRGCHNRCGFCYLSTEGLKMPYKMRDPEQVAREIADDGQPYAVFTDNNLGSNRDYLHKLCAALRPLEKIWSAAVTIDVTDDPKLVRAMALSGCTGVFIGFESLSDENLIEARKKTPRADDYARRVKILHENGIQVNGSFVLGFDHDRRDVFATLADWVEDVRLESATFHILTPYPATPLFRQMEAEGRLLHKDYRLYDTAHAVFRPRHMSPEELERGYAWLYQRLFSHASIWRRRPSDAAAFLPYLGMSYLYKRSNLIWHMLIRARMTRAVWSPLVEWTRRRHVAFRERLESMPLSGGEPTVSMPSAPPAPRKRSLSVVSAGL